MTLQRIYSYSLIVHSASVFASGFLEIKFLGRKIYTFKISIDTIKLMSNKAVTIYTHTHSVPVALYLYKIDDINLLSFCDVWKLL